MIHTVPNKPLPFPLGCWGRFRARRGGEGGAVQKTPQQPRKANGFAAAEGRKLVARAVRTPRLVAATDRAPRARPPRRVPSARRRRCCSLARTGADPARVDALGCRAAVATLRSPPTRWGRRWGGVVVCVPADKVAARASSRRDGPGRRVHRCPRRRARHTAGAAPRVRALERARSTVSRPLRNRGLPNDCFNKTASARTAAALAEGSRRARRPCRARRNRVGEQQRPRARHASHRTRRTRRTPGRAAHGGRGCPLPGLVPCSSEHSLPELHGTAARSREPFRQRCTATLQRRASANLPPSVAKHTMYSAWHRAGSHWL